jgi:protein-tyrosine phosphatase
MFRFIDCGRESGESVLVHCAQGKSRSAAVVIAFVMQKNKLSFADAMHLVKSKRPAVSTKFEKMLLRFQDNQEAVMAEKKHPFNSKPVFSNWNC